MRFQARGHGEAGGEAPRLEEVTARTAGSGVPGLGDLPGYSGALGWAMRNTVPS